MHKIKILAVTLCLLAEIGCTSAKTMMVNGRPMNAQDLRNELVIADALPAGPEKTRLSSSILEDYRERVYGRASRRHRITIFVFDSDGRPLVVKPSISLIKYGNPWVPNGDKGISVTGPMDSMFEISWHGYDELSFYVNKSKLLITRVWSERPYGVDTLRRDLRSGILEPGSEPGSVNLYLRQPIFD